MKPIFALILCLLFTIYLIITGRINCYNKSKSLLIPTIWIIIICSRMVGHWFNAASYNVGGDAYIDGSPIDRNIFSFLIFAALFVLWKRNISIFNIIKNNKVLIILYVFSIISIFWADYKFVLVKRWIKDVGNILMVLIILTEEDPESVLLDIIKVVGYILIPFSIILYKYYPYLGRSYHRWSGELQIIGVTTQKNSLGLLCMITGIIFIWSFIDKKKYYNLNIKPINYYNDMLIFLMIVWLLFKTNSVTSIICLLIGLFSFYVMINKNIFNSLKTYNIFIMSVGIMTLISEQFFDLSSVFYKSIGRDPTLTGRTQLWLDVLSLTKNKVIGVGYDNFWLGNRLDIMWEKWWWNPTQSHNGYIETYLGLGIVGVIILLFYLFTTLKKVCKKHLEINCYNVYRYLIFIIAIIYNMSESAFKGLNIIWFMLIFVSMDVSVKTVKT